MHSLSRGALGRLVLPAPAVDAHEGFVLAITAGVDQIGDGHVPVSIVLLCRCRCRCRKRVIIVVRTIGQRRSHISKISYIMGPYLSHIQCTYIIFALAGRIPIGGAGVYVLL